MKPLNNTKVFSKVTFYCILVVSLTFCMFVNSSVADEPKVMEGYVMEVDYEKGVFVLLEKYVHLKKSATQKEGWGTPITKENSSRSLSFSSIKVGTIVSAVVSGSNKKLIAEEIKILESKEKSSEEKTVVDKRTNGKQIKKIDGVWKN